MLELGQKKPPHPDIELVMAPWRCPFCESRLYYLWQSTRLVQLGESGFLNPNWRSCVMLYECTGFSGKSQLHLQCFSGAGLLSGQKGFGLPITTKPVRQWEFPLCRKDCSKVDFKRHKGVKMPEPSSQIRVSRCEALTFSGISRSPRIFISQQNFQKQLTANATAIS